jgi:hypothetical protein
MTTDKIEPALSAAEFRNEGMDDPAILGDIRYHDDPRSLAKIIALSNHLLPDSDRRKITRERLSFVSYAVIALDGAMLATRDAEKLAGIRSTQRELQTFADALASYLPPEVA